MATLDPLAKFILSYEGGFVNDPLDHGGATNKGVTIATWKAQGYDKDGDGDIDTNDLRLITDQDAICIMRTNYWSRWHGDDIADQSIANTLVDWLWGSGRPAITIVQGMLGVTVDGIVGPKTIKKLNEISSKDFFEKLQKRRLLYIDRIIANNPSQMRFKKGWCRRVNAIKYGYLISNIGKKITW